MKYFPIYLDAKQINAMVIGGGEVAARKIDLLLKSTTNISIMSETLNASVERLVNVHQLTWLKHNYQPGYLNQCNLVIAATDNPESSKLSKTGLLMKVPSALTNIASALTPY